MPELDLSSSKLTPVLLRPGIYYAIVSECRFSGDKHTIWAELIFDVLNTSEQQFVTIYKSRLLLFNDRPKGSSNPRLLKHSILFFMQIKQATELTWAMFDSLTYDGLAEYLKGKPVFVKLGNGMIDDAPRSYVRSVHSLRDRAVKREFESGLPGPAPFEPQREQKLVRKVSR